MARKRKVYLGKLRVARRQRVAKWQGDFDRHIGWRQLLEWVCKPDSWGCKEAAGAVKIARRLVCVCVCAHVCL